MRAPPHLNVRQYAVQRPGHAGEIERIYEQRRGLDLAAAVRAQEAAELLGVGPSPPGRLLLELAERFQLPRSVDDPLHRRDAERADELVLQVRDAHVEAQPLHVGAGERGAEAGLLQAAAEVALLSGVAEARQPEIGRGRAQATQVVPDVRGASHRHDGDALGIEVPSAAPGQRLERALVADALDEQDRPQEWLQCLTRYRSLNSASRTPKGTRAVRRERGRDPASWRLRYRRRRYVPVRDRALAARGPLDRDLCGAARRA